MSTTTQEPNVNNPLTITNAVDSLQPAGTDRRGPLMRFIDAFLQERNIKWVLGVGTAIVLGSSLMLVAMHWHEYTPIWKQLIMLAYTAFIACVGGWSRHKLGLVRTGTMLMALTLLLLPVLFLAMHWVQPAEAAAHAIRGPTADDNAWRFVMPQLTNLAMLLLTTLFAGLTASRILRHFLHGPQPTYFVSYMLLCLAGAVIPVLPPMMAPFILLALWAVATVGAVKVNRHVFWLVEEHRAPRVAGFAPIALLAGQLVLITAMHLAPHLQLPVIGLGLVLACATMLLTTDALLRVHELRTGGIVRPLPASIIVPLIIAMTLMAAGLALAFTGIAPPGRPWLLVPSAALASAMLFAVARRVGHTGFIWAGLIALTIAYNFSPVFFSDLARQFIHTGAQLVREDRLPYAFYGLTYLPLIIGLMVAGPILKRRGAVHLADPIGSYATGLSLLLLLISTTHAKAAMPVALVMTVVFTWQLWSFRQPKLAWAVIGSFIIAVLSVGPFVEATWAITMTRDLLTLIAVAGAALLLLPGHRIDARLMAMSDHGRAFTPFQAASRAATVALAAWWTVSCLPFALEGSLMITPAWCAASLGIVALLAAHAILHKNVGLAAATLMLAHAVLFVGLCTARSDGEGYLSIVTLLLIAQWFIATRLERFTLDMTRVVIFAQPARLISMTALTILTPILGIGLPCIELASPSVGNLGPYWISRIAMLAWCSVVAFRFRSKAGALVSGAALLATTGSAFIQLMGTSAYPWLPAYWSLITTLTLAMLTAPRLRGSADELMQRDVIKPLTRAALAILVVVSLMSLVFFTFEARIAAGIAITGIMLVGRRLAFPLTTRFVAIAINWQLVVFCCSFLLPAHCVSYVQMNGHAYVQIATAASLLASLSLLAWRFIPATSLMALRDMTAIHRTLLAFVAIAGLVTGSMNDLTPLQITAGLLSFVLLLTTQLLTSIRTRSEGDVWIAQGIAAAAIGFLAIHQVVTFGSGLSMYLLILTAIILAVAARASARLEITSVFSRPFRHAALALPMMAVTLGLLRHLSGMETRWLGANSLAMLMAAAGYFWHGLQTGRRRFHLVSAAILNIAIALLWSELSITDPQCFMIPAGLSVLLIAQLLKREIPQPVRDPVHYLGALIILVSPVFHIVGGSWLHHLSLMVLSVLVILAAIGFRLRPLVYTGTAFLAADLVAMVVRGSVSHPSLLWIAGIALGASVVALGAIAERHREELLGRMRRISAAIAAWD